MVEKKRLESRKEKAAKFQLRIACILAGCDTDRCKVWKAIDGDGDIPKDIKKKCKFYKEKKRK